MTDSFISGVESVGERWRGHLADDPGEVGKSAGTSQVGGDGWCCSERDCQSQLLGSGMNRCDFGILIKLHHTGWIFLHLTGKVTAPRAAVLFRPHMQGINCFNVE